MTLDRTDVTASGDSERSLILSSLDIISPIRGSGDGTANEQELGQLRKQRLNLSCRLSVEGARRVGSSRRHRPLVAASTILLPPGRLRKTAKGYLQMAPNPADWFARPLQHRNESNPWKSTRTSAICLPGRMAPGSCRRSRANSSAPLNFDHLQDTVCRQAVPVNPCIQSSQSDERY
jgi:hypothetical protein